jgi:hypothetical protein
MWEAVGIITVAAFTLIGFITVCYFLYAGLLK